jgi:hypothetical protein
LFNNVLGIQPGTLGKTILEDGKAQLSAQYAHITQIDSEKVTSITLADGLYTVLTNKNVYQAKLVVVAQNYATPFTISGLEAYLIPHQRANPEKNRIQLKHTNYLVKKGLYCCGTIAGLRSQFAIAAGSGATVATDILTLWNNGKHTKVHDKV